MMYHGFSFQLLAMNYGTIPKHKCCEFNVTMQLFYWKEKKAREALFLLLVKGPLLRPRNMTFLLLILELCP